MTIVQCSICMAAMLHEFFSSQSNWPVKLPARADRMLQRWHMAGFSSPLLANFPDCMKIQSGFFCEEADFCISSSAGLRRKPTAKLVKIGRIHF